jgi:hypothetical protein
MDTSHHPGIVFIQIYSGRRQKYPSEDEHLATGEKVKEKTELAEYVPDGLLPDIENYRMLYNLPSEGIRTRDFMHISGFVT